MQRSTLHLSEAAETRNHPQTNVGMQPWTRHPRFADNEMRRCREFGNFPILHSACPGRTTVCASASSATLGPSIRSLLQLSSRCLVNRICISPSRASGTVTRSTAIAAFRRRLSTQLPTSPETRSQSDFQSNLAHPFHIQAHLSPTLLITPVPRLAVGKKPPHGP